MYIYLITIFFIITKFKYINNIDSSLCVFTYSINAQFSKQNHNNNNNAHSNTVHLSHIGSY